VSVRLVMLGAPGAGKGTQGERFAREHGVPRIATGDILREAVQKGSELGRAARAVMEQGRLVGDEIMIGVVKDRVRRADAAPGFVLDGFPRTVIQAEALDGMVDDRTPLVVVDIEVPEDVLARRLSTRRICSVCGTTAQSNDVVCLKCGGALVQRRDDNAAIVLERLQVYEQETQPIVDFYRDRATFRSVDGDQTQDAVAADIAAAVASVLGVRS